MPETETNQQTQGLESRGKNKRGRIFRSPTERMHHISTSSCELRDMFRRVRSDFVEAIAIRLEAIERLLVTSATLVVTMFAIRNKCLTTSNNKNLIAMELFSSDLDTTVSWRSDVLVLQADRPVNWFPLFGHLFLFPAERVTLDRTANWSVTKLNRPNRKRKHRRKRASRVSCLPSLLFPFVLVEMNDKSGLEAWNYCLSIGV